jgi:hypothetical protein
VTECIHLLDAATCSICNGRDAREKADAIPKVEATFQARFAGECPECEFPIHEGQVVHRLSTGRYVHQGCQP